MEAVPAAWPMSLLRFVLNLSLKSQAAVQSSGLWADRWNGLIWLIL
jgi:hypothetical protein